MTFPTLDQVLERRGLMVIRQGRKQATLVTLVRFWSCASRFLLLPLTYTLVYIYTHIHTCVYT